MITLQNPSLPIALDPIEIDKAIVDLQAFLVDNISWLDYGYGRAYKHIDVTQGGRVYYPEVYLGTQNGSERYVNISPDNDKKGQSFFLVKQENINDFQFGNYSILKYNVAIIFSVNLKLINDDLIGTDYFVQNCIAEVRDIITRRFAGAFFTIKLDSVKMMFEDVFKEFNIPKQQQVEKSPLAHFRFDGSITLNEECIDFNPAIDLPTNGLYFNLDAALGVNSGSPTNGERITSVIDQSGNGIDLITPVNRDTIWNANVINNLPAFYFDNSYLANTNIALSSDEVSCFVVLKRESNSSGIPFSISASSFNTGGNDFLRTLEDGVSDNFLLDAGNSNLNALFSQLTTDPIILGFIKTSTNIRLFVNGIEVVSMAGTQSLGGARLFLGAASNFFFNGWISQVVGYDKAINATELNQVNLYLSQKFNI